ncbi:MAG TPA: PilZ domain-containing protein [Tepidisphaeraceae bacterium]
MPEIIGISVGAFKWSALPVEVFEMGGTMTEVRDDRSDVMAAIEDASAGAERRRAMRIRRKIATQMTPWEVGVPTIPFQVIIDDISETGVGIVHSERIEVGKKFVLTVPRKYQEPQVVECKVVRCESAGHGLHKVGLEACARIEHVEQTKAEMRVTSTRTRVLFLFFGIIGLAIAAFVPL